jgi:hypothetical protein
LEQPDDGAGALAPRAPDAETSGMAEPSKSRTLLLFGAVVALTAAVVLVGAWLFGLLDAPVAETSADQSTDVAGTPPREGTAAMPADAGVELDASAPALLDAGDAGTQDAGVDGGTLADAGEEDAAPAAPEVTDPPPKPKPRPARATAPRPPRKPKAPKPKRFEPDDL